MIVEIGQETIDFLQHRSRAPDLAKRDERARDVEALVGAGVDGADPLAGLDERLQLPAASTVQPQEHILAREIRLRSDTALDISGAREGLVGLLVRLQPLGHILRGSSADVVRVAETEIVAGPFGEDQSFGGMRLGGRHVSQVLHCARQHPVRPALACRVTERFGDGGRFLGSHLTGIVAVVAPTRFPEAQQRVHQHPALARPPCAGHRFMGRVLGSLKAALPHPYEALRAQRRRPRGVRRIARGNCLHRRRFGLGLGELAERDERLDPQAMQRQPIGVRQARRCVAERPGGHRQRLLVLPCPREVARLRQRPCGCSVARDRD
ncbi:MAG TPA: hypothetical protein VL654_05225 [Casimicrobiaceae bacterium]|nr:hypothetical protein [Casimicrobiaceae bacterium]